MVVGGFWGDLRFVKNTVDSFAVVFCYGKKKRIYVYSFRSETDCQHLEKGDSLRLTSMSLT